MLCGSEGMSAIYAAAIEGYVDQTRLYIVAGGKNHKALVRRLDTGAVQLKG